LQDFYPAHRQFYSNAVPLDELTQGLTQQVRSRTIDITKDLVDDLVDFLKSKLHSLTVGRVSDNESLLNGQATPASASEPILEQENVTFNHPQSTDIKEFYRGNIFSI
jgi:ABC-type phosphonate transport system ATPase subunit